MDYFHFVSILRLGLRVDLPAALRRRQSDARHGTAHRRRQHVSCDRGRGRRTVAVAVRGRGCCTVAVAVRSRSCRAQDVLRTAGDHLSRLSAAGPKNASQNRLRPSRRNGRRCARARENYIYEPTATTENRTSLEPSSRNTAARVRWSRRARYHSDCPSRLRPSRRRSSSNSRHRRRRRAVRRAGGSVLAPRHSPTPAAHENTPLSPPPPRSFYDILCVPRRPARRRYPGKGRAVGDASPTHPSHVLFENLTKNFTPPPAGGDGTLRTQVSRNPPDEWPEGRDLLSKLGLSDLRIFFVVLQHVFWYFRVSFYKFFFFLSVTRVFDVDLTYAIKTLLIND